MPSVTILSPVPMPAVEASGRAPQLARLRGVTLGLRYEWLNFQYFIDRLEEQLLAEKRIAGTRRWDLVMEKRPSGYARATVDDKERRQRELDEFAREIDAAVVGVAA